MSPNGYSHSVQYHGEAQRMGDPAAVSNWPAANSHVPVRYYPSFHEENAGGGSRSAYAPAQHPYHPVYPGAPSGAWCLSPQPSAPMQMHPMSYAVDPGSRRPQYSSQMFAYHHAQTMAWSPRTKPITGVSEMDDRSSPHDTTPEVRPPANNVSKPLPSNKEPRANYDGRPSEVAADSSLPTDSIHEQSAYAFTLNKDGYEDGAMASLANRGRSCGPSEMENAHHTTRIAPMPKELPQMVSAHERTWHNWRVRHNCIQSSTGKKHPHAV